MSKLHNFSWDDAPNLEGKFGAEFETQIEENISNTGDGNDENHDFNFGEGSEEEQEQGKKPVGKKKEEEEEEETYQFGFGNETEEDEESEEEDEEEEKSTTSKEKETSSKKEKSAKAEKLNSKGVLSFLKDKGLVELDESLNLDEMSEDEIEDQLEDVMDASNEAYFSEQVKDLPAVAKNLLKVAANGGDVNAYLATIASGVSSNLKKGMDLSTEANQELVMRNLLAKEGKDVEDIEHEIEFLKSKDRLASVAEKKYNKWEADVEKQEEELLEKETARKRQAKENVRKYRTELSDFLGKNKEVSSFSISVADKRELPAYIANPAYETPNGNSISEFQKDLFEVMKDNKKVVALAKILKSDFDFSKLIQKGANAALKDTKDKIQNAKPTPSGRTREPKRLIDFLDS